MRENFRQSISMEPTYRRGEPITLRYELQNTGDDDYALLIWESPLGGEVSTFVEVRHDDRVIPYDGRFVKRGDPTPDSYRSIAAGETIVEQLDLSTAFAFEDLGSYTVTVHTRFLDAVWQPGPAFTARDRGVHESVSLDAVSTSFELLEDGEPRLTSGQQARARHGARSRLGPADIGRGLADSRVTFPRRDSLETLDFDSGGFFDPFTEQLFAASMAADEDALAWVNAALAELGTWSTQVDNALYTEWFGADNTGRYQALRGHYAAIRAALMGERHYDHSPDDCSASAIAYTHAGSDTIYVCLPWRNLPATGIDSKFGTFVHEWSHAVAGTDDIAYGPTASRNLAVNRPQDAIRNADNHEYLVETLADRMLTAPVVWPNGKAYVFAAGKYWRYDIAADRTDPGYPLPINPNWPGLWGDRVDAGVVWPNGKAYFFRDGSYMRYDIAADRVDPGYPLSIAQFWPGLGGEKIDSVIVWPNGKAYFFRGSRYWRYDIAADRVDPGYPLPIAGNWPGLWGDSIQGAVAWPNGKAYFFRGWQYIRYDIAADRADGGYPRAIAENWPLLWSDRLDAAIMWPDGRAYFFRGSEYARYESTTDRVAPGYPLPIAGNWPGLGGAAVDAAVMWPNAKAFLFRGSQYWSFDVAANRVDSGFPRPIDADFVGLGGARIDAVIVWPNGKAYFFRGGQYWRYDILRGRVDDGYPLPIGDFWPGLGSAPIDAALLWPNGKAYFFRGGQYWRYDVAADRTDPGFPSPIGWNWPWLPGRVR